MCTKGSLVDMYIMGIINFCYIFYSTLNGYCIITLALYVSLPFYFYMPEAIFHA